MAWAWAFAESDGKWLMDVRKKTSTINIGPKNRNEEGDYEMKLSNWKTNNLFGEYENRVGHTREDEMVTYAENRFITE